MAQLPKISTVTHDDRIRLRNASAHGLPDHPTARGMKPADIKRMLADPVVGESDSAIAYLIRLTSELFYYDAALKGILNELRGDVNQVNENTDLMWGDGDTGSSIRSVAENVADSRLSAHNAGTDAHPDLRASIAYVRSLLNSLATRFNAMADSDDETLDQLSEMVAYIKANRGLIEAVTTAKVSVADIVDSLYSSEANKPLSAAQGAELRRLLELLDDTKLDTTQLPDAINTALHNAKESGAFGSDPAWTVRAAGEVVVPTTAWTEDENATVVLQGIEKGDLVLLFPSNELTRLICEKCHVHVSSSANETDDTVLLFRCRFAGQTLELPPTAMTFGFRVLACHDPLMCASAVIVGVNYDEVNHVAIEELGTRIDNLQSLLAGGEDGGKSIRSVAEEVTDDHDASPLAHADIRELIETLAANVYDKAAVDRLVSLIPKLTIEPVEALPEPADASLTAFYLVPSGESESDVYTEWFCVERDGVRAWERLGTQKMDLSGYATTEAMNAAIANAIADALVGYVTGVEVDGKIETALSGYVSTVALQTALTEALKSYAKTTAIPTKLSQLEADAAHRTVTDDEKAAWNSKAAGDHTHDNLYQPKGNYQQAGNYAAEGHTHDGVYATVEQLAERLSVNQGVANVGKILVVGTDGKLTLTDMPEGGASGDVVGTLDGSYNILLSGNLPVGTYTLSFVNEDGTYSGAGALEVSEIIPDEPSYTNLATTFKTGWRFKSDGSETEQDDGCICKDYIPFTNGTVVRIKGFGDLKDYNSIFYDASKTLITAGRLYAVENHAGSYTYDSANDVVTVTSVSSTAAFIRVSGVLTGTTGDVVITVNEPIV